VLLRESPPYVVLWRTLLLAAIGQFLVAADSVVTGDGSYYLRPKGGPRRAAQRSGAFSKARPPSQARELSSSALVCAIFRPVIPGLLAAGVQPFIARTLFRDGEDQSSCPG
jgi:hypothetical protein